MERVERVEDVDMRGFCAHGTVNVGGTIPISTAWFQLGESRDGSRWIPCRHKFFLPVEVLSQMFRGKFLALLRDAFADGKLGFHGQLIPYGRPVFSRCCES